MATRMVATVPTRAQRRRRQVARKQANACRRNDHPHFLLDQPMRWVCVKEER